MKFKVEKHNIYREAWVITGNTIYYLTKNSNCRNLYYDLYKEGLIDPPEIIKEKFNAFKDNPFMFKNKNDAERFKRHKRRSRQAFTVQVNISI